MSMPGFVFHFHCPNCDARSEDYSLFAFPDIFRPAIALPAWSAEHKCWCELHANITSQQRSEMETDRTALLSFAESMSSESLTVAVAMMGDPVSVTPAPECPHCQTLCETVEGYPPSEEPAVAQFLTQDEFRHVPISHVELSVRTAMVCRDAGICNLGQLEDSRQQIAEHARATDSTLKEIDSIINRKPEANGG